MHTSRERLKKTNVNCPAETYYVVRGYFNMDGVRWTVHGTGSTPTKARLDLLWQMGRRRTTPNGRY